MRACGSAIATMRSSRRRSGRASPRQSARGSAELPIAGQAEESPRRQGTAKVRENMARSIALGRLDSDVGLGLDLGGEPATHGVLGDGAGQEELAKIVGPAGLGADPRELEPAERLAVDERAGDRAVDVEVADEEAASDAL